MTLPLHHCAALDCRELINPGEIMCTKHWAMVSKPTVQLLTAVRCSSHRSFAEMQAVQEVAVLEGRSPAVSAHSIAVPSPTPEPKEAHS